MRKITFFKTLLVAAGLLVGECAWADENVTLSPTADTELNWTGEETKTTSYGAATTLNCGVWQEMWGDKTPGLKSTTGQIALLKFDLSAYKGKLTGATLKVTGTNPATNTNTRSIYLGYFTSTSWDETTTASTSGMNTRAVSGLNIQPFGLSKSITKGATIEAEFSSPEFLSYLNSDDDGIVSLIVYGVGQGCYINSKEAESGKPQLVLTYTEETLYTVSFTETNGLMPTVTVYSDADKTNVVNKDLLQDNTTYYYTALLEGYESYGGRFTVEASNPSISFTMTALPRYTFIVKAYDQNDGSIIETLYTDIASYDGKVHKVAFPKYLSDASNIVSYQKNETTYYTEYVSSSASASHAVSYTAYDRIAYVYEGEDYDGLWAKVESANYSNYKAARGLNDTTENITTIPTSGIYNINYAVCSYNTNNHTSYAFYKNNSDNVITSDEAMQWSVTYVKTTGTQSVENIPFTAGDVLQFYSGGTNVILDYVLVELQSIPVTITSAGWATLYTSVPLDFTGSGLTAYIATTDGETVSLTNTNEIPANSGVVLRGDVGTYNITVIRDSKVYRGSLTGSTTDALAYEDFADGYTYYVLAVNSRNNIQFCPVNSGSIAAGKAYLKVPNGSNSNLRIAFDDEATGIEGVEATKSESATLYNVAGQRVNAGYKGIVIKNGKKYLAK